MFKPGSIRKIIVVNFVTYSYAEMTPGPNLNMLIGPNGTGKSTIVAAIILGLGGNPKIVGRGTKISEYVKHNCSESTVEIRLQSNHQDELISITRHFTINDRTAWSLNGNKVQYKDIEEVTSQFNIQVNNLCQFLPQDRVQEFARLNKQQLLKQTQLAVCRQDLIDKQLKLVDVRGKHKELSLSIEKHGQKLEELRNANLRMEGKVQNLTKKKNYIRNIEDIERKIAWVNYDTLKTKIDKIKEDKVKALEILKSHRQKRVPIEKTYSNIKKIIKELQDAQSAKNQEVKMSEREVKSILESNGNIKSSISNLLRDLDSRLRDVNRRNQQITELKDELQKLNETESQLIETHGDETARNKKIHNYGTSLRSVSANISTLLEKKGAVNDTKRNKTYELQSLENELSKLENVKQQRLEWLRQTDRDAFMAVQWLRANKNMFKGEVYEPMMLELNVLNPQHAIYIENSISIRDRIAFTCVLKEDMNLLTRMLRGQQKLSVNILHSGKEQPGYHAYQPAIPIEQLKKYGMFAYINSLVTGPEPIMKYLCKMYQIHNTPVGNQSTNKCFEEVPLQIRKFFSDRYSFSISHSKYTGAKSVKQVEIRSDNSLSISIDTERLEFIRGQVMQFRNKFSKYDECINGFDVEIEDLNKQQASIRSAVRNLQNFGQEIDQIKSSIRVVSNKLQQFETDTVNKEQIEEEYNTQIQELVKKMVRCQEKTSIAFKKYSDYLNEHRLLQTKIETTSKQSTILENKLRQLQTSCDEVEDTINTINVSLNGLKTEIKARLAKAKQISNNCTPLDNGFDEFREAYNKLSDQLEQLEAEKEHILSKIDCLSTATVNEYKEYEEREQQITKLQENVEQCGGELDNLNLALDGLQNDWLQPLQELVDKINEKFSAAFQRMRCAGEVSIFTGENDKDFDQYGLSIKVKYRDAEPLQELNSVTQSGGERAVATAAYMLSLQELTPVPFRCVDEINQGMDTNNERRIFELLVDTTSQENTSQYFFITPKLAPKLKFVKSMMIHFVHNGPFIPSQEKWNKVEEST